MSDEEKKSRIGMAIMALPREEIIEMSWNSWIAHADKCNECGELVKMAREHGDKEKAWWVVGFSCAMDMIKNGNVRPSTTSGEN